MSTDYYDGNWHTWEGGRCPVTAGTIVEVELRGGERMKPHEASSFEWRHYDGPADIIRFRVVNSTTEEAEDLPNWHGCDNKAWTVTDEEPGSALLREIADAMDENPDGWINEFEFQLSTGEWIPVACEPDVFWEWFKQRECRRRPRTVHIEGEVPQGVIERLTRYVRLAERFPGPNEVEVNEHVEDIKALLQAAGVNDE